MEALATVEDIARVASVSVATVSRVLNSSPKVAPATRRRVLRVLDELGYAPNNLARNLRARALRVFGLVIPDIRNPVYTALHRGVEDVARASGFFVLLANTDEQPDRQAEYLRMLLAERVAGVILVSAAGADLDAVHALLRVGIPVVALDRPLEGIELDTVQPDRARGVRLAIAHLFAHGHQRIGLLNGPAGLASAVQRADAYRSALDAGGLEHRPEWEAVGARTHGVGMDIYFMKPRTIELRYSFHYLLDPTQSRFRPRIVCNSSASAMSSASATCTSSVMGPPLRARAPRPPRGGGGHRLSPA